MKRKSKRLPLLPLLLLFVLLAGSGSVSAAGGELNIAVRADNPFYSSVTEDGRAYGLEIAILDDIIGETEYGGIHYFPMDTMENCLKALAQYKVDAVVGLPNFYHGDSSSLETTSEIVTASLCVIAPKSVIDQMKNNELEKKVLVFERDTCGTAIVSSLGAEYCYVAASQQEALDMVLSGKANMMLCDSDCMAFLLEERGLTDSFGTIQSGIATLGFSIAVRKTDYNLLRELNEAIIRTHMSGNYDKTISEWRQEKPEVNVGKIVKQFVGVLIILLAIVFVYLYVSWRLRAVLKKKVADMTGELEDNLKQLQEESELRSQIIERAPNLMILCDGQDRIVLMNSEARRLFGSEYMERGTNIFQVPVLGDLLSSLADGNLQKLSRVDDYLLSRTESGGRKSSFRCSVTDAHVNNDRNGHLITITDVTKEEAKKQELIEQEKSAALSRMVAGIAHEIKNPLTGIQNFADLLRTEKDNPQYWNYFSEYVPMEITRISRLIESLMDYARPSKGVVAVEELEPLVRECSYLLNTAAKKAGVELVMDIPPGLHISVVRDQIKQVVINILLNALEAIERAQSAENGGEKKQPRIEIRACRENGSIVMAISDNGEGMEESALQNCTDPFFTTKESGTGLGLAISSQFVHENNGTMTINSIPGQGTIITLTFKEVSI